MFLFQVDAHAKGRTADAGSYSQISRALPIDKIKTNYANLLSEYAKIGPGDKMLTVGFFASALGYGGTVDKTNDAFIVAKTGISNPALPITVGGKSVPTEIAELDESAIRFDKAYKALVAADRKLAGSPNNKENAQQYLFAYVKYIQAGYDLQSRVQHFDQSGMKGVVNGITFALDAATVPLLAVGAGEILTGVKTTFQLGFKAAASQALKNMPKALLQNVLPAAAYSSIETGSEFYKMKDQQEAARKFKENAPEALKMLKIEILKLTMQARNEGKWDVAKELNDTYNQLTELSVKLRAKGIDNRALVEGFAKSFAIGMVMSAALSSGPSESKVARVAEEVENGFLEKSIAGKRKPSVAKETITAEMHAKDMPKIKDEKMLLTYLETKYTLQDEHGNYNNKFTLSPAFGGSNQLIYSAVESKKTATFGLKLHMAVPGKTDKDLNMVATVYGKLITIAEKHGFNFKFANGMAKTPEQAGKDFTIYVDFKTYEKALPDLKLLAGEIKAFGKNQNLADHLMTLNKANGGNGKINMLGEMPIEGVDYLRVHVRSFEEHSGIAVPKEYFAENNVQIDKKKSVTNIAGTNRPAVMEKDGYLIFNDKTLGSGNKPLNEIVLKAYQEGQVKVWDYKWKTFD